MEAEYDKEWGQYDFSMMDDLKNELAKYGDMME